MLKPPISMEPTRTDQTRVTLDAGRAAARILNPPSAVPVDVRPVSERARHLARNRNPFSGHAEAEYFLAWREGSRSADHGPRRPAGRGPRADTADPRELAPS